MYRNNPNKIANGTRTDMAAPFENHAALMEALKFLPPVPPIPNPIIEMSRNSSRLPS